MYKIYSIKYILKGVLRACMSVYHVHDHVHTWCLRRQAEGIRGFGTGVTDGYNLYHVDAENRNWVFCKNNQWS